MICLSGIEDSAIKNNIQDRDCAFMLGFFNQDHISVFSWDFLFVWIF